MNGFTQAFILISALLLSASTPTLASADGDFSDLPTVALNFTNQGKFEVLYSRARATGTGAIIGGLIGAAIESGVESSQDAKREKEILPRLKNSNCTRSVVAGFKQGLARKNNYQLGNDSTSADFSMDVRIRSCGFRVIDTTRVLVSSYVELDYELPGKQRGDSKDQYIYMTGKKRLSWLDLNADNVIANEEFDAALVRAGKRLANKFIYR